MNNFMLAVMKQAIRQIWRIYLGGIQILISWELEIIREWHKCENLWDLTDKPKDSIGKNLKRAEEIKKAHFLED